MNVAAAESASVWACRRAARGDEVRILINRGVLVGDYIVTAAHVCAFGASMATSAIIPGGGPLIRLWRDALPLGSVDHSMTVSIASTKPQPVPNGRPAFAEIKAKGGHILAGEDEKRVHPVFADPYTDLGVLADHPEAPGTLAMMRKERTPIAVRRRPVEGIENLFVLGERGWGRAIARAMPGPNVPFAVLDDVLVDGDCGGPVVDERGELVGIMCAGVAAQPGAPVHVVGAPEWQGHRGIVHSGILAQLCLALPAWLHERAGVL